MSEVSTAPSPSSPSRVVVPPLETARAHGRPNAARLLHYWSPDNKFVTFQMRSRMNVGGPSPCSGAGTCKRGGRICPGGPLFYAIGRGRDEGDANEASSVAGADAASSGDADKGECGDGNGSPALPTLLLNNGFLKEVSYAQALGGRQSIRLSENPATFRAPCLISVDDGRGCHRQHAVFVDEGGAIVAVDTSTKERTVVHTLQRVAGGVLLWRQRTVEALRRCLRLSPLTASRSSSYCAPPPPTRWSTGATSPRASLRRRAEATCHARCRSASSSPLIRHDSSA